MTSKFKFFAAALVLGVFALVASASAATYTWSTTLKQGSKGAAVMDLQKFLNMWPGTQVATSGAGAPGMETTNFGPATKAAVIRFQVANGLTADGVFGPMSAAKAVALQASGSTGSTMPAGCVAGAMFSSTTGQPCSSTGTSTGTTGSVSGGETSISDVNVDDADDDTLNEGASKAPVASIEFNVDDADAQLTRADIVFQAANDADEENPWRAFDKVYLMDGSTVIASMDVSKESAWDDADDINGYTTNDAYRIRLTGINRVFKENSDPELWVAVDVADSVDGADDGEDWAVAVETDGLRFIDGAGVDTEEDAGSDAATFSIEESGGDSELSVTEASTSPDASSLEVKTTATTTSTIAIFKVEADEDGGDIKLADFPVTLQGSTVLNRFIDDVYVVVDGKEYSADQSPSSSTLSQTFTFEDIEDDDVVIDAGDDMDVTVKVKFKSQQGGNSENGTTVYAVAAVTTSDVEDADTGDDIGDVNGSATADTFTLFSDGISVDLTGGETPTTSVNNDAQTIKLTYNLTFKVTAFGDDVYVPKAVAETSSTTAGLLYEVEDSSGSVNTTSTASSGSLQSSAEEVNGYFKVEEGETETFTVQVSVTKGSASAGFYHVQLNAVQFDTDTTGSLTSYTLSPENDFDTTDGQIDA